MTRLALLVAIFIGCVNAVCPPDFVASTMIPGKCYYLTAAENNFFSAIDYCRNLTYGADILAIANRFEDIEVTSLLQSREISSAFAGNAFYDNKSHWIATAAGSSIYSHWGSGTYNGFAALIHSNGDWSYAYSSGYYGTICQIYPDDPTTFPPPQITCPDGWTPSISVRGKCYRRNGWTDFFSATRRCLTTRIGDAHAELLTLTSQLEMMELTTTQYGGAWVSLTSWKADGNWHWVETLHPTDYFGPDGQPVNYRGTCASLGGGNLSEEPCWRSMPTICQYFPHEPPAPTPPGLVCPQNGIASLTKPGTCYYVLGQHQTFQSARNACQTLDTGFSHNDLFVPRTRAEYEEFEAIVLDQDSDKLFWLGLTSSNGGIWRWISRRSSDIIGNWCSRQHDILPYSNDHCGYVISSNRHEGQICWTAGSCMHSHTAICQSTNTF